MTELNEQPPQTTGRRRRQPRTPEQIQARAFKKHLRDAANRRWDVFKGVFTAMILQQWPRSKDEMDLTVARALETANKAVVAGYTPLPLLHPKREEPK